MADRPPTPPRTPPRVQPRDLSQPPPAPQRERRTRARRIPTPLRMETPPMEEEMNELLGLLRQELVGEQENLPLVMEMRPFNLQDRIDVLVGPPPLPPSPPRLITPPRVPEPDALAEQRANMRRIARTPSPGGMPVPHIRRVVAFEAPMEDVEENTEEEAVEDRNVGRRVRRRTGNGRGSKKKADAYNARQAEKEADIILMLQRLVGKNAVKMGEAHLATKARDESMAKLAEAIKEKMK